MKILKFFIILLGLITLASTDINAQKFHAPSIEVEIEGLSNTPLPPGGFAHFRWMNAEFEVEISANVGTVELALSIYDSDGNLLQRIPSGSPTDYHKFTPQSITAETGDLLYIECGFMSPSGMYYADGGCTVIVDPYGVSMYDGN